MLEEIEKSIFNFFIYRAEVLKHHVKKNPESTIIDCRFDTTKFNIICHTHLEKWAKKNQDAETIKSLFKEPEAKSFWNILSPSLYATAGAFASHRYGEELIPEYLNKIINRYEGRSFSWFLSSSCTPSWISSVLIKHQFIQQPSPIIMTLPLAGQNLDNKKRSRLTIHKVVDVSRLADFLAVLSSTNPELRPYYKSLSFEHNLDFFVGYDNEQPIVGLNFFINNKNDGILDIITKTNQPEYFEEIIGFIRDYAIQNGCTTLSVLGCCPQLVSFYRSAGFSQIGELVHFIWQV